MQPQWQPIFAPYHLSEATASRLVQSLVQIHHPAGKILQLEGEECRGIYWILSGELSVFRIAPDGRELILRRLRGGEIVNLVSAFENPPLTLAAIRAERAAECLWLSLDEIPVLLNTCPDLAQAFLRLLATRLHHMTSLLEQIGLHSVRGRLARFLIDLADGNIPARQYTQDEMAAQIGTVRDMIGRTLKAFEDAGLIERQRSHILLKDRTGLEAAANE